MWLVSAIVSPSCPRCRLERHERALAKVGWGLPVRVQLRTMERCEEVRMTNVLFIDIDGTLITNKDGKQYLPPSAVDAMR